MLLKVAIGAASGRLYMSYPRMDVAETRARVPSFYALDVMRAITGRVLAIHARDKRPGLPVLYTTGYTRNAVVHNGTLDPGVKLLGKPYTLEQLAHRVRETLDA